MTTTTAEHLDRLRNYPREWVGEQVVSARRGGRVLKELWLDDAEWDAVCDWFGSRTNIPATSMTCVISEVWLRPSGDLVAAKERYPLRFL